MCDKKKIVMIAQMLEVSLYGIWDDGDVWSVVEQLGKNE